jgi:ParB-like chromosome segregation protein Spo0J
MTTQSKDYIITRIREFCQEINQVENEIKIELINSIRSEIHKISPFKNEPVDFVRWVKNTEVYANDYNPNKVAPPEMELLKLSIEADGYTQPIVSFATDKGSEVIDGFHRHRVGKESKPIQERIFGYLPVVTINDDRTDKKDRIASTIRHNRARGKHGIDAMSEIVIELKNRNWKNERIAKELGMDEEEILRLCQITGLQEIFKDDDFSKSWEASDSIHSYEPIDDYLSEDEMQEVRTVNTSDPDRIFHTHEKWECHKAGFYANNKEGITADQCEKQYAEFLSDIPLFKEALNGVINEWINSCEHYLTNKAMNRIAWLGQAAMCYATGIPSKFCSGFNLLTPEQQDKANLAALDALNFWMVKYGRTELSMDDALSVGRQVNIY